MGISHYYLECVCGGSDIGRYIDCNKIHNKVNIITQQLRSYLNGVSYPASTPSTLLQYMTLE